jgi:hypothetical protein
MNLEEVNQRVTARFELITPEIATQLLETNHRHQRKIIPAKLKILKNELNNGRWAINGESIKINELGEMIDGQYRTTAIKETGIEAIVLVVRNLPVENEDGVRTMATIDSTSRTLPEVIQMAGFRREPANLVKLVRLILGFNRKTINSKPHGPTIPRTEITEEVQSFDEEGLLNVIRIAKNRYEQNDEGLTLEAWLLLTYLDNKIEGMTEFTDELIRLGENTDEIGNAASMLLRFFKNKRNMANKNGGLMLHGAWYAIFNAFDKFKNNVNTTIIQARSRARLKFPEDYEDYDV